MTRVGVQIIESLRAKYRLEGRSGTIAVGLSLQAGTCEINHVVCGEWGWYKGPGSVPPMLRGDVITSVDGQIVLPADVGKLLHAGPLGSRVQVKALRGNLHTQIEATLVRQDGLIVDGLVHVEEALDEVKGAAQALGGRPGSVLEARLAALGRQVAKLGSACAKQEALLSDRAAAYQGHVKELEQTIVRLAQGDLDDEAGRFAMEGLRDNDHLQQQIQQLEAELAARAMVATELAEVQRQLHDAEQREIDRARVESKEHEVLTRGGTAIGVSDGLQSAEFEAKIRQLQTALSLAKTDLAAARIERDKALGEAEKTKVSANDCVRVARKDLAEEKGTRELCNTKMMVAKREAEEARASQENHKKRMQHLDRDTSSLRADATRLQKQLDEKCTHFDTQSAQIRDKANSMLKDKDAELKELKIKLTDTRIESENLGKFLTAKENQATDLAAQLKALLEKSSMEVSAMKEQARVAEEKLGAAEVACAMAADGRANAKFESDRMRQESGEVHARLDELERLLLRSQEQTGALKVRM